MLAAGLAPRLAAPEDAAVCARIKNDWIDASDWMPRVHSPGDVERHYREFVFRERTVWVVGDPVAGYLTLDAADDCITALFVGQPGHGFGHTLLDHAKAGRLHLELWTFVANTGARRFYEREGFRELRRTDGDNEEGLPDVLLRWERAS